MEHPELRRIQLARELGVAPDNIDLDGLMGPLLPVTHVNSAPNLGMYLLALTPREAAAYQHIMDVADKYIDRPGK